MKIGRVHIDGHPTFAVQAGDETWVPLTDLGVNAATTADVISHSADVALAVEEAGGGVTDPTLLAPIVAPSKMLAIGLNYMDHIREQDGTAPENPIVFAKYPSSLNDPTGDIVVDPDLTHRADYEAELAVIIGKRTRSVSIDSALSAVYGYAVANDVSARDWQKKDGQFSRSKSFDTFCPIGPWITTSDEVGHPNELEISWVNGDARQDFDHQGDDLLGSLPDLVSGPRDDSRAPRRDPDRHTTRSRTCHGPAPVRGPWRLRSMRGRGTWTALQQGDRA
jgi:5-carboxymethyl-2-hydroxymuconate isomerase